MKTTVDIGKRLLTEAKKTAAQEGTTLKALIEEGLRKVVEERKTGKEFRLRRGSFRGQGVQPPLSEGDWTAVRELLYEGRGS